MDIRSIAPGSIAPGSIAPGSTDARRAHLNDSTGVVELPATQRTGNKRVTTDRVSISDLATEQRVEAGFDNEDLAFARVALDHAGARARQLHIADIRAKLSSGTYDAAAALASRTDALATDLIANLP